MPTRALITKANVNLARWIDGQYQLQSAVGPIHGTTLNIAKAYKYLRKKNTTIPSDIAEALKEECIQLLRMHAVAALTEGQPVLRVAI